MQTSESDFRPETHKENENARHLPPECIMRLRPPNIDRVDLTDREVGEALVQIWNKRFCSMKFPRERKLRVDPSIPQQRYGIISFMPAPNAIPDKQGCYGCIKLRGNFDSVPEAEKYAKFLLRKHDSYTDYDLVVVGQEFPLMIDNSMYTEESCEVNLKAVVDEVTSTYIKKKKEEERLQREEVEDRHRRLVSAPTSEEKQYVADDLEFYTELRAKKAHCQWVIDDTKRKADEAKEVIKKCSAEIAELDEKYPDYRHKFTKMYEDGLKSIGAKAEENPTIAYMKKDVEDMKNESLQRKQDFIDFYTRGLESDAPLSSIMPRAEEELKEEEKKPLE